MNNISVSKIQNTINNMKTIAKDAPQCAETLGEKISAVIETASSQSAKVTQLHEPAKKATQSLNSARATNIYKKTDNEPFFKIINQDGQKILITSNMENPKNAIVTFFNDGKPGKCFECTFEELGSRCGIHI